MKKTANATETAQMTDATLIKLKPSDWFPGLTPASRLSVSAEWGVIIDGELVARIAKRSSGWTVEDPKTYVRIQGSERPDEWGNALARNTVGGVKMNNNDPMAHIEQ